jgi:hypothetical protein
MYAWLRQSRSIYLLQGILLLGVLLTSTVSLAQSGGVAGVAKDPHGALITQAKVTLTNLDTQIQLTSVTNGQGTYAFDAVPAVRYSLKIQANGFQIVSVAEIKIADGISFTRDFDLVLALDTQTVNVNGEAEGVNDYVVTHNISGGKMELPVTDIAQDIVIIP